MKKLMLAFSLLFSVMAFGQMKVNWMTMNEALEAQKKEPKKILIHFFAQWCPMCKRMEGDTYSDEKISAYINENFYPIRFDAEGGEKVEFHGKTYQNPTYDPKREVKYGGNGSRNQFADYMGIRGYPTMVLLDEQAIGITSFSGYIRPKEIEPYLAVIATDDYKKIQSQTDWEEYLKNFEQKSAESIESNEESKTNSEKH